jgi:hypothetical protein
MNTLKLDRERLQSRVRAASNAGVTHYVASLAPGGGTTLASYGSVLPSTTTRANAACWKGYERTPGTEEGTDGSCRKKGSGKKKKKSDSGSDSDSDSEDKKKSKKRSNDGDK